MADFGEMLSPQQICHKSIFKQQNSSAFSSATPEISNFVSFLCSVFAEARSYSNVFKIVNTISTIIVQIQLVTLSFCINIYQTWDVNSSFFLISSLFSVFHRICPFSFDQDTHFFVIITLFFIEIAIVLYVLFLYLSFKPGYIYTSFSNKWIPIIFLNIAKVLFIPSSSLFFYSVLHVNNRTGVLSLILATFGLIAECFGFYLEEILRSTYPSFGDFYNNQWSSPPNFLYSTIFIVMGFCYEFASNTDGVSIKLIFVFLISAIFFISFIFILILLPCTLQYSNFVMGFVSGSGFSISLIAGFGIQTHLNIGLLFSLQILSLVFMFVLVKFFIYLRYDYLTTIIDYCFSHQDFTLLKKYSSTIAINMAAANFRNDWSIFEYLIELYPNCLSCYTVYARFLIFFSSKYDRLREIIELIYKNCHLRLCDSVFVAFLEMIYVQSGSQVDLEVANNSIFQVVDDYFLSLHLFWTEVLLGKPERLVSLSYSVNAKFNTARSVIENLGKSAETLHHYQRFKSISSFKFTKLQTFKNHPLLHDIAIDSAKVFKYADKNEIKENFEMQDIIVAPSLTLEQAAIKFRKKLSIGIHLTTYFPIYTSLIIALIIIVSFTLSTSKLKTIFIFEKTICSILYKLYTPFMIDAINALQISGIAPKDIFTKNIQNAQWFSTMLQDPINDSQTLIEGALNDLSYLYNLSNYVDFIEQVEFLHKNYSLYLFISEQNQTYNMMFSTYVNLYAKIAINRLNNFKELEYVYEFFGTNVSQISATNAVLPIVSILPFFVDYPNIVKNYLHDQFDASTLILENIVTLLIIIGFLVQTISNVYIYKIYNDFFINLFSLPKNSISELINTLGSRITGRTSSNDRIDLNLKYNLTQLSYQEIPQSFPTSRKSKGMAILSFAIIAILFRIIYMPVVLTQSQYVNLIHSNVQMSVNELKFPLVAIILARESFELIFLQKTGIRPPNDYYHKLIDYHLSMTGHFDNNYAIYFTDSSFFPTLHDTDIFFGTFNCGNNQKSAISCRSLSVTSLMFISQMYHFNSMIRNNEIIDNETINTVVSSIISVYDHSVPSIYYNLFLQFDNEYNKYIISLIIIFLCFLFFIFFIWMLSYFVLARHRNDKDFSIPFLSSIPAEVLTHFRFTSRSKFDSEIKEHSIETIMSLFENEDIVQYIVEMAVFCSSDNIIIASTPSAQTRLLADESSDCNQFLERISLDPLNIELPPEQQTVLHIDVRNPELQPMFLKTTFIPIKKAKMRGKSIAYVVTLVDVAQRENLIAQINIEANKVKMLVTQLVPWSIAPNIVNGGEVQPAIIQKLTSMFFLIRSDGHINSSEIISIQNILRELLNQYESLSFFGRTLQIFQVIGGITVQNMPLVDLCAQTVDFALNFINNVKVFSNQLGKNIDIYCGVHLSGPYYTYLLENESSPVYDVFGNSMTICELIALKSVPNRVNVTREVYEQIFSQGFNITFEDEIETINGMIIPVHKVQRE